VSSHELLRVSVFGMLAAPASMVLMVVLAACGLSPSQTAAPSNTPTATPVVTAIPTLTPVPVTTATASARELTDIAATMYPRCTASTCAGTAMFTTCDAGASGTNVFAGCPLTPRLVTQLENDVAGLVSAPDPLGGGQDPEWTTEAFNASPSSTGGVVHVALGFGQGEPAARIDLLVVLRGSDLLVDDIYCSGIEPDGADAYAPGWPERSVCSS
jgi:hypothetical protein